MATTFTWTGRSGRSYTYNVYQMPANPNSVDGNYVFAKIVNGRWQPIYFGQGDLRDRYNAAIREGCVTRKGATHWHAHTEANAQTRRNEESDLIAGNSACRPPSGCNEVG